MPSKIHFVYFIYGSGALLYIGRSFDPAKRLRAFKLRTGIANVKQRCFAYDSFSKAQIAELKAIDRHKPKLNKLRHSSCSMYGKKLTVEQRAKISAAQTGKKRKYPVWNAGKKMNAAYRKRCQFANLGRCHSEETKRKMSEAHKKRFENTTPEQRKTGRKPWNAGKKMNKAYCERCKLINLGRYPSRETKHQMSESAKRVWRERGNSKA